MIPNGHRVHAPRRIVHGQRHDGINARLIDLLLVEKLHGRFGPDQDNTAAISSAVDGINSEFNKDFPVMHGRLRLDFLRRRFHFYNHISNHSGVVYEQTSGNFTIDAATMADMWERMSLSDLRMIARGERRLISLRMLFTE